MIDNKIGFLVYLFDGCESYVCNAVVIGIEVCNIRKALTAFGIIMFYFRARVVESYVQGCGCLANVLHVASIACDEIYKP